MVGKTRTCPSVTLKELESQNGRAFCESLYPEGGWQVGAEGEGLYTTAQESTFAGSRHTAAH